MINNQSLAVTWRPKCLQDVVGQDVLISVLSKQIETGTFKNAYLFAGPSGCGKTSVARIMATPGWFINRLVASIEGYSIHWIQFFGAPAFTAAS